MAANPWGGATATGAGAWALDAERAEAEELAAAAIAGVPAQSFPSLSEAAATKPKKKKPTAMPLSQFATGSYTAPGTGSRSHAPEPVQLPTGPRERSAEELDSSRLGGGFRSYGDRYGDRGGGDRNSGGDRTQRRPYGGGFDDDQRRGPPGRESDMDQPSRADEVDNWATKKAFVPSVGRDRDSDRDRERYSSLGGGPSRADELDNWSTGKKSLPPPQPSSRSSSFGSGFRDSSAVDSDRWVRGVAPPSNGDRSTGERPRFVLDPPKKEVGGVGEVARTRPSPFGAARPREEVLKEKGVDVLKLEEKRPTSSHSSRPSSAHSDRAGSPVGQVVAGEGARPVRAKVNPFGDAKPREVLLQERGKDWRKIDSKLEHDRVNRPETDEEKLLKEEIDNLNKASAKESEVNSTDSSSEKLADLREQINQKEKQLEQLICELDDKVRFGQRSSGDTRPGFGAGEFNERPRSRGGMESERPRSRGTGDAWEKPMDEKRRIQGARESNYFGTRNMERPKSREGW